MITHVERLDDGRYNIVLRGVERFRILEENHDRRYRRAQIEPLAERTLKAEDRAALQHQRSRLETLLAPSIDRDLGQSQTARANASAPGPDPMIPAGMADEELVNALAQYLDLEPIEKQALLERQCLRSRAESLVELLEMKLMLGADARRLARRALGCEGTIPQSEASERRWSATIFSPWNRPFSMKTLLVSRPQMAPPARNRPGTLVSNVSGS